VHTDKNFPAYLKTFFYEKQYVENFIPEKKPSAVLFLREIFQKICIPDSLLLIIFFNIN